MSSVGDAQLRETLAALLDALLSALELAFALVRLNDPHGGPSIESTRVDQMSRPAGDDEFTFASARVGRDGQLGLLVAASRDRDFPHVTDRLHLDLAATQAALVVALDRERQLRLLVDTIPALVCQGAAEGDLDFLNQRAVEYLGTAERLSKVDACYTTKDDGMGIGLSVSRSIIETHHGRLWAELNDGPGATISFAIPVFPHDPHSS